MARAALESGKHALVEIPIAMNHADAVDLADLAERRGLVLGVVDTLERGNVAAFAKACAQANPDRLLWGSNWPRRLGGTGQASLGRASIREIDDGAELVAVSRLTGNAGVLQKCLVDNPARLYGFSQGF